MFVSALLVPGSRTAELIAGWRQGRFTVLTSAAQLEKLARVTRYPKIRERLSAPLVGRLVKELKGLAEWVEDLPPMDVSPHPFDNDLLSSAQGGGADYLVTGDKRDLLSLARHDGTASVGISAFLGMLRIQTTPPNNP